MMDEHLLDDLALQNGLLEVDAKLKLIVGIGAILICVSSPSPIAPLAIAGSMAVLTICFAGIPARVYAALLAIPVTFLVMSTIVILLMTGGGEPLWNLYIFGYTFNITTDSANLSILLLSRTLGGMSSLFFIALSTPMVDIFSVMKQMRLPDEFIDLSMLIYRNIFVLIGESIAIHNAQVMRNGYSTFKRSIAAFAMLGGMLFIRAWEKGEEMMLAMDARCYDGKLQMIEEEKPISSAAIVSVAGYLCFCAGLAVLFRGFSIF